MDNYCVALDGNGHFVLANLDKRVEVIKLLKTIHDGDYWANEANGYMEELGIKNETDLLTIEEVEWFNFVRAFEQRGTMEIKHI